VPFTDIVTLIGRGMEHAWKVRQACYTLFGEYEGLTTALQLRKKHGKTSVRVANEQ
jgi:hypothetical protein